jgi:hypothetical protein
VKYPLIPVTAVLFLAACFALWAIDQASRSRAAAERAEHNLQRARNASDLLTRIVPRHMPAGGAQTLVEHLEGSLVAAGADKHSVRSVNVQSLGRLSDVPAGRQQARVELTGLTMRQAAIAIDTIEVCALPVWIESMDLSAADGAAGDSWNAVIHVNWIARTADAPSPLPR